MPIKDLTGQRFGRLVVIDDSGKRCKGSVIWSCKCDCGNTVNVSSRSLNDGSTKSCGCLQKECVQKLGKKYGKEAIKSVNFKKYLENDNKENTRLTTIDSKRKTRKDNTSGAVGVAWAKRAQAWRARIKFKGKEIHLGCFKNKQDAIDARKEAEKKYFKPILDKYKKTDSVTTKPVNDK